MKKKVLAHFKRVDPVLYRAGMEHGGLDEKLSSKSRDHFENLCRGIVGQQLSGKAAGTIYGRFEKLLRGRVTPERVLKLSDQQIRDVGLSWAKVKYVKDLAQKVLDREVRLEKLEKMSDEGVVEELTKVKGIGLWTAEMYMMFTLGREDLFSHGDLGLKRGIEKLYGVDDPSKDVVEKLSQKWSPYRTYACLVLWKSVDG